jgi:hypothetical protein
VLGARITGKEGERRFEMSRQRMFLTLVIGFLVFSGWLLALQSKDTSPKPEHPTVKYVVQQTGNGALMLDPLHGKTWMLRREDNGNALWLPIPRIDSEKEAVPLWPKTEAYNLGGLKKNEQPRSVSTLLKERGYVNISLDKLNCGYIGVQMRINGEKVYLILDSGQPVTHLDPERTKQLQLKWAPVDKEGAKNNPRAAAATTDCLATVNSLEIGNIKSGRMLVGGHDLSEVNKALKAYLDPPIDGELGSDVMAKYGAIIDFAALELYLRPKKTEK